MSTRCHSRFPWYVYLLAAAVCAVPARDVLAHPMGNFAICHYTRLLAEKDRLRIRYVLDIAEIPTVAEKAKLDRDRDAKVTAAEKEAYLAEKTPELLAGLRLRLNGRAVTLREARGAVELVPGAGGLDTLRIVLDLETPLPASALPAQVGYRDGNYAARAGWKEIVAVAGPGLALRSASVPATDRSRELTAYPPDAVPPQDTEASFTVAAEPSAMGGEVPGTAAGAALGAPAGGSTPRDAFTDVIAQRELSLGLVLAGLGIAFAFGALHALAPGHGKAMVAAYLVGARGTAKHAAFLGLVVTVTHTLGVFLLGLVTLGAAQYVLPERLYPILEAVSGLAVFGVGVWLLYRRLRRWLRGPRRPANPAAHHHHHEMPEGPITWQGLLALGISGGLVPCPSALVVLLSAVALHRIGYGLLLITAFSVGLASVLIALGLLVVYARQWLDRLPRGGPLLRRLPVASAAVITLIGVVLLFRALEQIIL